MTREEWAALKPDERAGVIARHLGWTHINVDEPCSGYCPGQGMPGLCRLPDIGDLNVIVRQIEPALLTNQDTRFRYEIALHALNTAYGLGISAWETVHADAAQRAEALALTLEPACPTCKSHGFKPSQALAGRCEFCDDTVGGVGPGTNEFERGERRE
jgi:hypothetical protein